MEDKRLMNELKAEQAAFEAELPALLERYAGKFVVFHGGKLFSVFETYDDAYSAALAAFGLDGVFLIAQVVPPSTQVPSVSLYAGVLA